MNTEFRTLNEYFEKYGEIAGLTRAMTDCSGNDNLEAVNLWKEICKYIGFEL